MDWEGEGEGGSGSPRGTLGSVVQELERGPPPPRGGGGRSPRPGKATEASARPSAPGLGLGKE